MEPVTIVVSALAAGAAAGLASTASKVIADAYEGLKTLVIGCLQRSGTPEPRGRELIDDAGNDAGRTQLSDRLAEAGVDEPTVRAAQRLLDLLEAGRGKFIVDASQARGVIIGDHSVQHNTFN